MASIKYLTVITLILMCVLSAYSEREAKRIHSSFRASSSSGKRENSQNSLLDTFSLSWSGNFDFSRSFAGFQKIFEGIFTCKYNFVNLDVNELMLTLLSKEFLKSLNERLSDLNSYDKCIDVS